MATAPCAIGRTIQRPAPMWAMMDGAIPANRLKVKAAELLRGGARTRVFAETRRARVRRLKPPDTPGGFQPYVMRDRDFIATKGESSMANSTTIPRESRSADSTAARSRSVAIHRLTSSTKPLKRPIAVSITPSPRTLRTDAKAAAALADLSDLEGVIHSLLSSALEKIVDRMDRASLRSDGQSRRPLAIAETDSSIEPSARSPAEPRETMLRVGALELDLINRTAKRGDRPIDLLPSGRIAVLELLASQAAISIESIGTHVDVTEQYAARGALQKAFDDIKKSEDRLRLVIDTIPALVWRSRPD